MLSWSEQKKGIKDGDDEGYLQTKQRVRFLNARGGVSSRRRYPEMNSVSLDCLLNSSIIANQL